MELEKINVEASNWARESRVEMQTQLRHLSPKATGRLVKSIQYKVGKTFGVANRISFNFLRHGVFVEKGVGRGYPITRVKEVGNLLKSGRKPKPWFNTTMDKKLPDLAENLQMTITDAAAAAIKIK